MSISEHLTTFAGLPVQQYDPESKKRPRKPCVYRVGWQDKYDEENLPITELLDRFLSEHGGKELTALVIGAWDYEDMVDPGAAGELVEALVTNRKRMPNLRALFFGDITYDECEISCISYGDISALLPAFPKLEEFRIRGTANLTFGKIVHRNIKSFAIESGGLPEALLQEVWAAELPKLEHLELWLGSPHYEGIADPATLEPLLSGRLFKKLKYLGLRNSEIADAVARAVTQSKLLERLQVLDLSLGNLGDVGAEALLTCPNVRKLKKLDLHHHYITPPFIEELQKLPMEIDLSEAKTPNFYTYKDTTYVSRYIAVSE